VKGSIETSQEKWWWRLFGRQPVASSRVATDEMDGGSQGTIHSSCWCWESYHINIEYTHFVLFLRTCFTATVVVMPLRFGNALKWGVDYFIHLLMIINKPFKLRS